MFTEGENEGEFMKIVDDLVINTANDSELAEGLKWIDIQSRQNGVTFYEMAMIIMKKHAAERRAREWMKTKTALKQ